MHVFWRVLRYMRPYWLAEVIAYLAMFGINAVGLLTPQITRTIIDDGITAGNPDVLQRMVLLLLGAIAVRGVMRFTERYLTERVSQGIAYQLRDEVYRKLQRLSFSYHDQAETGQLLSRTTRDVERLRRITGRGLLRLLESAILLIGTSIIVFRMNALLAALSLSLMPFIVVVMRWFMRHMHPLWHGRQDMVAQMTSLVEENLLGRSVVRGFAQEPAEIGRFREKNDAIFDVSMDLTRGRSFTMPLVVLLASLGTILVLWYGGRLVIQDVLTLGALVAFNSYLLQLIQPMRRIGFLATMMGESYASAQRVFEVLDAESDVKEAPDAKEIGRVEGRVTFRDVSFAYVDGSPVLSDVDFEVEPGEVVALLGPTGSGKTTVTNLIPRFYDVSEGAVLVDGTDVRDVTLESLRRNIGMVLQEPLLLGDTVREAIRFGRPDASQEEIEAAAKAAAAHEFIMDFPEGYDTYVGERGLTLSGGQRQRVAIARALLLDPRILILDDATSSVDTETEQRIQAALNRLMEGRTSFVIAQRVSTVRNADKILVIDDGRLVAEGQHADLIQRSGVYADIYYRQLRREDRERIDSMGESVV